MNRESTKRRWTLLNGPLVQDIYNIENKRWREGHIERMGRLPNNRAHTRTKSMGQPHKGIRDFAKASSCSQLVFRQYNDLKFKRKKRRREPRFDTPEWYQKYEREIEKDESEEEDPEENQEEDPEEEKDPREIPYPTRMMIPFLSK